jgi:hypothetical protein
MRLCTCDSGKYGEEQFDGYGIYLCITCEDCHEEKMSIWRADINEAYEHDEPLDEEEY